MKALVLLILKVVAIIMNVYRANYFLNRVHIQIYSIYKLVNVHPIKKLNVMDDDNV